MFALQLRQHASTYALGAAAGAAEYNNNSAAYSLEGAITSPCHRKQFQTVSRLPRVRSYSVSHVTPLMLASCRKAEQVGRATARCLRREGRDARTYVDDDLRVSFMLSADATSKARRGTAIAESLFSLLHT